VEGGADALKRNGKNRRPREVVRVQLLGSMIWQGTLNVVHCGRIDCFRYGVLAGHKKEDSRVGSAQGKWPRNSWQLAGGPYLHSRCPSLRPTIATCIGLHFLGRQSQTLHVLVYLCVCVCMCVLCSPRSQKPRGSC